MIHHIGVDEDQATALISKITRCLEFGMSLGAVRVATVNTIMTADGAIYGYDNYDDSAWRMWVTPHGVCEITRWGDGEELSRRARKRHDI